MKGFQQQDIEDIINIILSDEHLFQYVMKLVTSRLPKAAMSDTRWRNIVIDYSIDDALNSINIKEIINELKKGKVKRIIDNIESKQESKQEIKQDFKDDFFLKPSFSPDEPVKGYMDAKIGVKQKPVKTGYEKHMERIKKSAAYNKPHENIVENGEIGGRASLNHSISNESTASTVPVLDESYQNYTTDEINYSNLNSNVSSNNAEKNENMKIFEDNRRSGSLGSKMSVMDINQDDFDDNDFITTYDENANKHKEKVDKNNKNPVFESKNSLTSEITTSSFNVLDSTEFEDKKDNNDFFDKEKQHIKELFKMDKKEKNEQYNEQKEKEEILKNWENSVTNSIVNQRKLEINGDNDLFNIEDSEGEYPEDTWEELNENQEDEQPHVSNKANETPVEISLKPNDLYTSGSGEFYPDSSNSPKSPDKMDQKPVFFDHSKFEAEVDRAAAGKKGPSRNVRFQDQLVDQVWYRDRLNSAEKKDMFYTAEQENEFTNEQNKEFIIAERLGMSWSDWIYEKSEDEMKKEEKEVFGDLDNENEYEEVFEEIEETPDKDKMQLKTNLITHLKTQIDPEIEDEYDDNFENDSNIFSPDKKNNQFNETLKPGEKGLNNLKPNTNGVKARYMSDLENDEIEDDVVIMEDEDDNSGNFGNLKKESTVLMNDDDFSIPEEESSDNGGF